MAKTPRSGRPHAPRRPDRSSGSGRSRDESARSASPRRAQKKPRAPHGEKDPTSGATTSRSARATASRSRRSSRPSRPGARTPRDRARDERRAQRLRDGSSMSIGGVDISVRLFTVVVLASVLAALLVPNLYQWWQQERDYQDIQARVAAAEERNAQMRETLDLWNDPEYVASQARERLGYVKPGETQYAVVDPGDDYQDKAQVEAAQDKGPARPWIQVVGILLKEADKTDGSAPVAFTTPGSEQSGGQSGAQSASQPQSTQ